MNNGKVAELKDRLREAMDARGVRPVDIVEQTGIPKSMVSYYLSGKNQPKADRLYVLAQALGVSEAWLMGYDVPIARSPEQKKNDALVHVVKQLRSDPDFFSLVKDLAELPADQYSSIKALVSALRNK
jgi:transcriptional regulator with XRE-family HTH domain